MPGKPDPDRPLAIAAWEVAFGSPPPPFLSVAFMRKAVAFEADVSDDSACRAMVKEATQAFGRLDILVNNYGTAEAGSWEESESEDWITAYQKNVLSAQRLIRHFLPALRDRPWGRIINLGTVGSTRPNARMPHYYAAKGALATMTISLARETAGTGIRVNLVSPGLILTPEVEAAWLAR